jgi:hypothetical protein
MRTAILSVIVLGACVGDAPINNPPNVDQAFINTGGRGSIYCFAE